MYMYIYIYRERERERERDRDRYIQDVLPAASPAAEKHFGEGQKGSALMGSLHFSNVFRQKDFLGTDLSKSVKVYQFCAPFSPI